MLFSVISTLAFAASALAAQGSIQFTSFPSLITVGRPVTLKYTGGDGSPVKIVLRRGPSDNLKDVETLTTDAKDMSYTWTPSMSLASGTDYALEIIQGADTNYGKQFGIKGLASSVSSGMPLSTAMPSAMKNATYPTGNTTTCIYCSGMMTGTALGTAASATGTGMPYRANTTFSSATLSATTGPYVAPAPTANGAATATGSAAPKSTSSHNGAGQLQSSLALIGGAVAAFVFLN